MSAEKLKPPSNPWIMPIKYQGAPVSLSIFSYIDLPEISLSAKVLSCGSPSWCNYCSKKTISIFFSQQVRQHGVLIFQARHLSCACFSERALNLYVLPSYPGCDATETQQGDGGPDGNSDLRATSIGELAGRVQLLLLLFLLLRLAPVLRIAAGCEIISVRIAELGRKAWLCDQELENRTADDRGAKGIPRRARPATNPWRHAAGPPVVAGFVRPRRSSARA